MDNTTHNQKKKRFIVLTLFLTVLSIVFDAWGDSIRTWAEDVIAGQPWIVIVAFILVMCAIVGTLTWWTMPFIFPDAFNHVSNPSSPHTPSIPKLTEHPFVPFILNFVLGSLGGFIFGFGVVIGLVIGVVIGGVIGGVIGLVIGGVIGLVICVVLLDKVHSIDTSSKVGEIAWEIGMVIGMVIGVVIGMVILKYCNIPIP